MIIVLLWITFLLLAPGEWTAVGLPHRLGGYAGLATAIAALYLAAADVINEAHDRVVLPVGPYIRSAMGPLTAATPPQSSYANR